MLSARTPTRHDGDDGVGGWVGAVDDDGGVTGCVDGTDGAAGAMEAGTVPVVPLPSAAASTGVPATAGGLDGPVADGRTETGVAGVPGCATGDVGVLPGAETAGRAGAAAGGLAGWSA
jgi:hypothetical protein